jgi:hypothetical protein
MLLGWNLRSCCGAGNHSLTDHIIPFNVLATEAEHPYGIAASALEPHRRTWPENLRKALHFSNVVTAAPLVLIEDGLALTPMPALPTIVEVREQCLARGSNSNTVAFSPDRSSVGAGGTVRV